MEGSHTGVNICNKFMEVLEAWQLTDKVLGVVTDNATNNDTFVRELSLRIPSFEPNDHHFRCVAHVLNLVVQKAVDYEPVKVALAKLRRIIVYIRASPQREQLLKDAVAEDESYIKLQVDCCTRWNSTLDMVERFIRLRDAINVVVAQLQRAPSSSAEGAPPMEVDRHEWDLLSKLATILQPFKEVSVTCEGENYPTLNRVVPLYNKLLDKMEHIIEGKHR